MAAILVVDDTESVRQFISRLLEREGYTITTCERADAALALFGAQHFDLVVTDIFMHGMDGLELIRELRGRSSMVPILAMSGDMSPTRKSVLKAAGAFGALRTIEKPFTPSQFLGLVRELFRAAEAA